MAKKIILAETAGVCFGVERALRKSFEVMEGSKEEVHSLGPIIHNPQVVKRLEERGVKVAEKLEDTSSGTVIIRAHGVPVGTVGTAKDRGLNVVDLTCPIVKKLQYAVKKLAEEGSFTVIVGDKKHPEIIGARSYGDPEKMIIIENKSEIGEEVFTKKKVGIVAQTTIAFEQFREVVDEFLARSTEEIKIFNTICDDIFNKQREAIELAKSVDVMVVIGGKNSSNTTKIAKLCHEVNPNTYQIETVSEIRSLGLNLNEKTIGVTAGASTPSWIIEEMLQGIQEI
ncbi:MAG: 4-hydroxy-3-methylbut-2-enyl diphosphate reductase [Deltaproteobacteria bacterium]|nr:4-hydroxy-3-methylbut-2-enyl diphosphate reductase [Deltaproteobacteria bacterium]